MSDFDTKFPSLKGKEACGVVNQRPCLQKKGEEHNHSLGDPSLMYFFQQARIEEHCLDKQRVREVIDVVWAKGEALPQSRLKDMLKKELNL